MDAPEAELDIKLQKISGDLIAEFDRFLPRFLRKTDSDGSNSRVRSRLRARELQWATSHCLDPFQELPQLLDPHLPKWIPYLSEAYLEYLQSKRWDHIQQRRRQQEKRPGRAQHLVSVDFAICKILYTFCKIRGEKVIVHFLNAETRYLELLLTAMEEAEQEKQPSDEGEVSSLVSWSWEQRYVVLLWLSHLLLAPFDLSTISSVDLEDVKTPPVPGLALPDTLPGISLRMIPLAIKYLASPGKERDGAKALLVRMAMRRDMQQLGVLDVLVQWALKALRPRQGAPPETTYYYLGILSFLAGILQSSADTSDMNKFLKSIFDTVHGLSVDEGEASKTIVSFAQARKVILKVIRSVIVSLLRQGMDDMESTEMTETSIGHLLESVSDNDTPVRFAASKALSIITLKLDPDMASQVVEAVLESLNRNVLWKKTTSTSTKPVRDMAQVNHLEWHGLMLTLSHLLYRRSPPAEQLSDIIHALLLGLSFEQRGTSGTSLGSNVRDAACFGIWALARRYTTQELLAVPTQSVFAAKAHPASSSILQVLGTELTVTASLDPAGNIRRGSSAALQELIGRHPDTVEKGIWVVQTVDYHAVARRSRAMEEVALNAAKLAPQYGEALVDSVLGWRGVGDVDAASRRDVGNAFGVLTTELALSDPQGPLSRFESTIDLIIDRLRSLERREVEQRHGLLICFAATLDQLPRLSSLLEVQGTQMNLSESKLVEKTISGTISLLEAQKGITYRKPELIVEATSRVVASLLPILQYASLPKLEPSELTTMDKLLPQSGLKGYSSLVSTLDAQENRPSNIESLLSVLRDAIPQWFSKSDPEAVNSSSLAALTLLIFSNTTERGSILHELADAVRSKPTSRAAAHGDAYFHTLALAQPLIETLKSTGEHDDIVCDTLLARWNADNEVETRVAILQALTRSRILHDKPSVFVELLSNGLNDYTTTARGDVGSHVRVQALRAVKGLWKDSEVGAATNGWEKESDAALFYNTLRLASEKLDRIRPKAQAAVSHMLQDDYAEEFRSMTFSSQGYFNALLNLIHSDSLRPVVAETARADPAKWMAELMAGFVTSADTGNEDLVIASRAALTDFCGRSPENLDLVCSALLHNLKTNQGQDRIVVPTLEIIAFLFHVGLFQRNKDTNLRSLCLQTQKAGYKTGNVRKLEACVRVYGGVAGMNDDGISGVQEARKRLGALLFHPWPKVRTMVVDQIWGIMGNAGQDEYGEKLTGVDWGMAEKSQLRSVVHELRLE